jgi:hypothetical protein
MSRFWRADVPSNCWAASQIVDTIFRLVLRPDPKKDQRVRVHAATNAMTLLAGHEWVPLWLRGQPITAIKQATKLSARVGSSRAMHAPISARP